MLFRSVDVVAAVDPDTGEAAIYIDDCWQVSGAATGGGLQSGEWAGTDNRGYGRVGSGVRDPAPGSNFNGTLVSDLSFYSGQLPANFPGDNESADTGPAPEVRKNGSGPWASSVSVSSGDTLNVRMRSDTAFGGERHAVIELNGQTADWSITNHTNDSTPNTFNFQDQTLVNKNVLVTSNIVTISSIDVPVTASVSGDGNPEIRINGGSWTTSGTVNNGDTVQSRMTTNSNTHTGNTATVTIGSRSDTWTTIVMPRVIFLTSGSTWTVPSDWNSSNNSIEVIGAGGGGGCCGSGGGGGGAYARIDNLNLTPGSTVSYSVGRGGTDGNKGGDTYFNGSFLSTASVGAQGGQGGRRSSSHRAPGGRASNSVGTVKYSGGNGGDAGSGGAGAGGGGGAAGPNGPGGNGGNVAGGNDGSAGGGGANGGGNGTGPSGDTGGRGGNNRFGTGGGNRSQNGTNGGGGGGKSQGGPPPGFGSMEVIWTQTSNGATAGPAGGSGAGSWSKGDGRNGVNYGAGGGGWRSE